MKKLLLIFLGAGLSTAAAAQDMTTDADKKIQLGMAYQFGLNFNKPDTKLISRDGVGVQNMIGMNLNYSFNKNIGFFTGIEFDFESFRYQVGNTPLFYDYNDTEIRRKKDDTENSDEIFRLTNRKQKAIYGTIPTMVLFRTDRLGAFRYYGKFGARTGFLLSSSSNDEGFTYDGAFQEAAAKNTNMKSRGDLFFLRSSIGLAAGTEWNFTGSTSLFAELGFYYGFTPVHNGEAVAGNDKERNMTLYQLDQNLNQDYVNLSAKQKQIVLKVGILF